MVQYHDLTFYMRQAIVTMKKSQGCLTPTLLSLHFPRTSSRIAYAGYAPDEERRRDFADISGALCWPAQGMTGDGIGWVCFLGRSMISELGSEYGYCGQDGLISREDEEE